MNLFIASDIDALFSSNKIGAVWVLFYMHLQWNEKTNWR